MRQLLFMFPGAGIAALLGLPEEDLPEFHRLAVQLIGATTVDWDRALQASAALRDYFAGIVDERRRRPADDMISVLVQAENDGQRLTDEEIFAFCRLLLPAGAETTYRSSSNLLVGLLTNPDQLAAVVADRSLVPLAIEEGVRWEPPLLIISRTATRDTEGQRRPDPGGRQHRVQPRSANHDESRWPDAERFDIFRERRPHIGFAHGPHMCLGMHLARMETQVALGAPSIACRACASTPAHPTPTSRAASSGRHPGWTSSGIEGSVGAERAGASGARGPAAKQPERRACRATPTRRRPTGQTRSWLTSWSPRCATGSARTSSPWRPTTSTRTASPSPWSRR